MADLNLDYDAIGQILKETCAPAIYGLAQQVAAGVKSDPNLPHGARVSVKKFVTDRAISVVLINHPDALSAEAKHGVLKKAAASQGLEVKSK